MREACANSILMNKKMIGGPGYTIEIDEAMFTKRKNNAERQLPEQWIFGGICRNTRVFMVAVPDRTANTLECNSGKNCTGECYHVRLLAGVQHVWS